MEDAITEEQGKRKETVSSKSSRGASWERLRIKVLERDNWTCNYCGKHLEGADGTADHVIAKANGGEDRLDNLIAACRKCNGTKSDHELIRLDWRNKNWLG